MAKLPQSLRLDLTDTLSGDLEFLAHFFQRSRPAVIETEAQAKDAFLPRRQRFEHIGELFFEKRMRSGICRRRRIVVGDEVAEVTVLLFADRRFKGNRLAAE